MTPIPELTTQRLLLRPFNLEDADRVTALLQRPEISQTTMNIPWPYPEGAAASWIRGHEAGAEAGHGFTWAITRQPDSEVIGAIGMAVDSQHRRGSLGYWLAVDSWNQGITSEAAQRIVQFGFDTLDLHRIEALCLPRNVASSRVMQKAGMEFEGILRGYFNKGGVFEDVAMYAVVRKETSG